jgi:hypothetical protein
MRGLLADVNLQGHLPYVRHLLEASDLSSLLDQLNVEFATFPDLNLSRQIDDRKLWNFCQDDGWVLFTNDRKMVGVDSLEATLRDSWHPGMLPVITLSNRVSFESNPEYASRAVHDIAQILFDLAVHTADRDRARIYVPL